jgi:hypothetical protein
MSIALTFLTLNALYENLMSAARAESLMLSANGRYPGIRAACQHRASLAENALMGAWAAAPLEAKRLFACGSRHIRGLVREFPDLDWSEKGEHRAAQQAWVEVAQDESFRANSRAETELRELPRKGSMTFNEEAEWRRNRANELIGGIRENPEIVFTNGGNTPIYGGFTDPVMSDEEFARLYSEAESHAQLRSAFGARLG